MMKHILPAIIIACSCFLLFYDLGDIYLWQDEAETANVSRTILQEGIPKGFDGLNSFSQQEGGELGPNNEWKLHSWFHFYWQALFFALFGINTVTARVAFAVLGLATVVATYFLAKALWKKKEAALITLLLITFSVPFLLLARQSRYYSAAMFFMMYTLLSYVGYLKNGKSKNLIHLGISMFLLFHSQYLYFFTFIPIAVAHSFVFHRSKLPKLLLPILSSLALCLPFLYWLSGTEYSSRYADSALFTAEHFKVFFLQYSKHFFQYAFAPWLLVIPLVFLIRGYLKEKSLFSDKERWSYVTLLSLVVVANLVGISLFSLEYYYRYLAPLLPVAAVLAGLIIAETKRWHFSIPWLVAAVIILTGPIYKFVQQLNTSFTGPVENIIQYLDAHLEPGDTIAITYGDLPLKFYFPDHKIYGGLTGEDLGRAPYADWIILRNNIISEMDKKVFTYLLENTEGDDYERINLTRSQDTPFENRESPFEHYYSTVRGEPAVRIFKRQD